MKRLENVLGVVGGLAAMAGCLIPVASRGTTSLGVGEGGGIAVLLYVFAGAGLLVSLLALFGRMRREEWVQIAAGVLGLLVTWLVHRNLQGAPIAFGMHLLYWGFAMLLAEGLIHFDDRRVALPPSE
ncbi:MAG: hypothetical protein Q4F49_00250 [Pseudoxanthomonas suwonensis]|nr:hypothetical protein [Pseudoxanthomonas suwonensis]